MRCVSTVDKFACYVHTYMRLEAYLSHFFSSFFCLFASDSALIIKGCVTGVSSFADLSHFLLRRQKCTPALSNCYLLLVIDKKFFAFLSGNVIFSSLQHWIRSSSHLDDTTATDHACVTGIIS